MDITFEYFKSEVETKKKNKTKPQRTSEQPEYKLCCSVCKSYITDNLQHLEIEGRHSHSKTNPANQTFLIRCFSSVKNCKIVGEKTAQHSWFMGCQWQFVHCKSCSTQLGWYFSGRHDFYGLIEEQLVLCDE